MKFVAELPVCDHAGEYAGWVYNPPMVSISFQDRATERKALGFLLGRFSGRALKGGEHLVPQAAVDALKRQGIPFVIRSYLPTPSPG